MDIAPVGWLDAGRRGLSRRPRCRSARRFDCLWCGAAHTCRGPDDLEGWAQLCPDCVGKAGDNGFLRFRLRQAITERPAAPEPRAGAAPAASRQPPAIDARAGHAAAAPAVATPPMPTRR